MPRSGSIPTDIASSLRRKQDGAAVREIGAAVRARRGHVLQHSIRSAVYANLDDRGERLFRKEGDRNGPYSLKR